MKGIRTKKITFSLRLPSEIYNDLKIISKETRTSMTDLLLVGFDLVKKSLGK